MKAGIVDTHAHLDGAEFEADRTAVVERAAAAGVSRIVSAGQDQKTSRKTLALAQQFARLAPAVGVHPHLAKNAGDLGWLERLLVLPQVVAAGEMGLDYHYDFSPRHAQRDVFARQLQLAATFGLPSIVHCREAVADVIETLKEFRKANLPVVVHCFTESYNVGRALVDLGNLFLGIGGAVTFKKANDLHDAVTRLPLDCLVLETDCPYMSPVPYRGRRNEPAYIELVCKAMAALRGMSFDAVAAATTANAQRLFPKLALPAA